MSVYDPIDVPPARPRQPWLPIAAAAVLSLAIGGFIGNAVGSSDAERARTQAGRAESSALTAQQDSAAARTETDTAEAAAEQAKTDATTAIEQAKTDASAAVAKAKTDAAAGVAADRAAVTKAKAEAAADAQRTVDELAAQKAGLDKRARDLTGAEAEAQANEFEGDGIYRVGVDIKPGTYKAAASGGCYYARLRSLTAEGVDGIIDNNNVSGVVVIVVRSSDVGLEVNGCSTFRKVG